MGESEGEVSEIKRVEVGSAVEKWESAADIRIASRHMQAVRWGAAAPSFQLARSAAAVQDQGAERGTTTDCGLCTKLASDTSANRRQCCTPGRLQYLLAVCQLVHEAAVCIVTAGGQIIFHALPAHARQCQLARYLLTCV